jgi:chaperonin cofactor prefoldin
MNDRQLVEAQIKFSDSSRNLVQAVHLINLNKVEQKRGVATVQELDSIPENTVSYKSVGRMFIADPLPSLKTQLRGNMHTNQTSAA